MPQVTVVCPVYNAGHFLTDTIESVLSQTHSDLELLLIDDCSTDNSKDIIDNYASQDSRVRLVALEQNSGPAVARNVGINQASGRYIAFIDSDDVWLPAKLEVQLSELAQSGAAVCFSSYVKIAESDSSELKTVYAEPEVTYEMMLKSNYIGCSTAIFDCEKVGKVLMPNIRFRQDYGLWLRILAMGHIAVGIREPLVRYRVRSHSVSSNKLRAAFYHWKVMRSVTGVSLPRGIYLFCWYVVLALKKY